MKRFMIDMLKNTPSIRLGRAKNDRPAMRLWTVAVDQSYALGFFPMADVL